MAERHTISIFFLGRYRPAYFEGATFEHAFMKALEAASSMDDEAAFDQLADWLSDIAAKRRGAVNYSSIKTEHGPLGVSWDARAHDPWLDDITDRLPPCPGLAYPTAPKASAGPADPDSMAAQASRRAWGA